MVQRRTDYIGLAIWVFLDEEMSKIKSMVVVACPDGGAC